MVLLGALRSQGGGSSSADNVRVSIRVPPPVGLEPVRGAKLAAACGAHHFFTRAPTPSTRA